MSLLSFSPSRSFLLAASSSSPCVLQIVHVPSLSLHSVIVNLQPVEQAEWLSAAGDAASASERLSAVRRRRQRRPRLPVEGERLQRAGGACGRLRGAESGSERGCCRRRSRGSAASASWTAAASPACTSIAPAHARIETKLRHRNYVKQHCAQCLLKLNVVSS